MPPHATVPFTVIVRALIPKPPPGKPAALAGFHRTGDAVSADVVDHSGVELSHVPLVFGDNPLLSQYQTAADTVWANNIMETTNENNVGRDFLIIDK
jgi:hypothetical protein